MVENPFAGIDIRIPTKYSDAVKQYCQTASTTKTVEYAPFDRQVDFWFVAFAFAVKNDLEPEPETDTTKVIEGSILGNDPYRIALLQLAFLASGRPMSELTNARAVMAFATETANAGIPRVLQLLGSNDDKPLYSLVEAYEDALS